ncbi:hypothetical protein J6W34_01320 [bacterium]|nr:hypothetical protein [bacterium]
MAHYTITIKTLIDNDFDFGLNSYPIFNEGYRSTLNSNILNYYFESEIGVETPALFKKLLNDRMQLIMSKYNVMYQAQHELLQHDLLSNVNLTETYTGGSESESESSSTGKNRRLYQDTPQGKINMSDLDVSQVYATDYTIDQSNSGSSINDNSTSNYIKSIIGNNGNMYNVDVFNKFISSFTNIDQLIIDELSDLFMGIF